MTDEEISQDLRPGELVLWSGKPKISAAYLTFAIYIFAIPWTAFSVFWELAATAGFFITHTSSVSLWMMAVFSLFGLPFVVIGIGMLAMPFLAINKQRNTRYYITDKRVITHVVGRSKELTSLSLDEIKIHRRRERRDGSGDLVLAIYHYRDSDGDRIKKEEGLFSINNVRGVEAVLEKALKTT